MPRDLRPDPVPRPAPGLAGVPGFRRWCLALDGGRRLRSIHPVRAASA